MPGLQLSSLHHELSPPSSSSNQLSTPAALIKSSTPIYINPCPPEPASPCFLLSTECFDLAASQCNKSTASPVPVSAHPAALLDNRLQGNNKPRQPQPHSNHSQPQELLVLLQSTSNFQSITHSPCTLPKAEQQQPHHPDSHHPQSLRQFPWEPPTHSFLKGPPSTDSLGFASIHSVDRQQSTTHIQQQPSLSPASSSSDFQVGLSAILHSSPTLEPPSEQPIHHQPPSTTGLLNLSSTLSITNNHSTLSSPDLQPTPKNTDDFDFDNGDDLSSGITLSDSEDHSNSANQTARLSHHTFGSSPPGSHSAHMAASPPSTPSAGRLLPDHIAGLTTTTDYHSLKLPHSPSLSQARASSSSSSIKTNSPRPSTAPSPSVSLFASSPSNRDLSSTTSTFSQAQAHIPPSLPPIPAILSHSPTRSHLFQHLLQNLQHQTLNHLILLLDLLAVIRGHASQTNWSFDDPFVLPPPPPPPMPRHSVAPQTKNSSRTKSRLHIRPGTSDGLAHPSSQRHQTRSHMPGPTLFNPSRSLYSDAPNVDSGSSRSALSTENPTESSWATHFVELYSPPELDLTHGWFIPLALPQDSLTLQSLNKNLPRPNQSLTINLGVAALKKVGEIGCKELSEATSVKDWWTQHSTSLWPQCSLQSKCESFNDLLALWPSLHFPTPSLSQLYKISAQLSKSRTRMRLAESSPQVLPTKKTQLSRAALLGLFEVHLGQPSLINLTAIERLFSLPEQSLPVPQKASARPATSSGHASPVPSLGSSPSPSSRPRGQSTSSGSSSRPSTSSIFCSPLASNELTREGGKAQSSRLIDFRSHKLRQFFGHEVDSMLPPKEPTRRALSPCFRDTKSSYISTFTTPDASPSLVLNNNRRKSINTEFDEPDRPRKRSTTATIDISLANLATSASHVDSQPMLSTPTSPDLSGSASFKRPMTRVTIVGNSPTTTPTFFTIEQPRFRHLERHLTPLGSSEVEQSLSSPIVDGFSSPNSERAFNSNWQFPNDQQQQENEARALKRMTKLEKILGEPVNAISGYAGLGVNVVTEVVEDIDAGDYYSSAFLSSEMGRHRSEDPPRSPFQWNNFHSRASSAQGIPSAAFPRPCISSTSTVKPFMEPSAHSSARPKTTHFDKMHNPSSSIGSSRTAGKWRLDKLHRFLGDVTHSGQQQATDDLGATSSGGISNIHMRIDSRYRFPESEGIYTGGVHHHNNTHSKTMSTTMHRVESPPKEPKKRPSRFKISSSGTKAPSESVDRSSSDQGSSSRPSSSSSTQPRHHASASSTTSLPSNTPVPFGQYSYRSARKLEKLLGEQIPSSNKTSSNPISTSSSSSSSSAASSNASYAAVGTPHSGLIVGWHNLLSQSPVLDLGDEEEDLLEIDRGVISFSSTSASAANNAASANNNALVKSIHV
ncbi:hypothetical protein PSTG_16861 [Puccinia striiformis f. sp. tritici PST-78]|uniref:Uncharacterized protein n=1 Tax=Puccinia striiformis f. sp. tritici PST-78 TaxID=1165861 RepID=A0A0L0USD9_9BASI|nr:hypothetical protein PSTG_16861 [Puccinia striiformis f. sp. tritici PST-78]